MGETFCPEDKATLRFRQTLSCVFFLSDLQKLQFFLNSAADDYYVHVAVMSTMRRADPNSSQNAFKFGTAMAAAQR